MLFKSQLSRKGVVFLLLPLALQLICIGHLMVLFEQVELELVLTNKAGEVSNILHQVVKDIVQVGKVTDIDNGTLSASYYLLKTDLSKSLGRLHTLLADQPADRRIIEDASRLMDQCLNVLETAHDVDNQAQAKQYKERYRTVKREISEHLTTKMIPMAEAHKRIANQSAEKQQKYSEQMRTFLFALLVLMLVVTIVIVWGFSQFIVNRLERMVDNCMRFASHEPLNPTLPGSDEIAKLDQVIHRMADAVNEMSDRERALMDNATDVICSLDLKGTFLEVNRASIGVFGYSPEELLRTRVVSLMMPDDEEHALERIEASAQKCDELEFETRIIKKDGTIIDTSWSVYWSQAQERLFCVVHDITERKRIERLKKEVLQMISHDLKTPLGTISTFMQILESGALGQLNEKGEKLLKVAEASSNNMLRLIQDLLDIETLESGMLRLDKKTIVVNSLFQRVEELCIAATQKKDIQLTFKESDETLVGDADRLVQVLSNLVSNAIKFTPNCGRISVLATKIDGAIEFKIVDNGRGIPDEFKEKVFERFSQTRLSDSKLMGGSGLGLSICKGLVELHGGTIWVESTEGEGSTFIFRIPTDGEQSAT